VPGYQQRVEQVPIENIKTAEPFRSLFPRDEDRVRMLVREMNEVGYDRAFPVIIWEQKNVVLDGHNRLEAAKKSDNVGGKVWACYVKLADEERAVEYALQCQGLRRNLSGWDIYHAVRAMDNRRNRGPVHTWEDPQGKEKDRIAFFLKVSPRQIQKCFFILSHEPTEEELAFIKTKSINFAYNEVRRRVVAEAAKNHPNLKILPPRGLYLLSEGTVRIRKEKETVELAKINRDAFPSDEAYEEFLSRLERLMENVTRTWWRKDNLLPFDDLPDDDDDGEEES